MKKQAQLQVAASKDLVKAEKEALKKVREKIMISFFHWSNVKYYCDTPFMIRISERTVCVSVLMKHFNCINLKIHSVQ